MPSATGAVGADAPAVTTGSGGTTRVVLSGALESPLGSEFGVATAFTNHERVDTLKLIFASVELVACRIFIAQRVAGAVSNVGSGVRFGLAPRDLAFSTGTGSTAASLAAAVPHMNDMWLGATVSATQNVAYGEGGRPFPPGLQLDFRAAEMRHKLPVIVVLNPTPNEKHLHKIVAGTVEWEFVCTGVNFGAPLSSTT